MISAKKVTKWVGALLLVLGGGVIFSPILGFSYLWVYKQALSVIYVTDPSDPKFKSEEFNPKRYVFQRDLVGALNKMFPKGTPKEKIEIALEGKVEVVFEADEMTIYQFPTPIIPPKDKWGLNACSVNGGRWIARYSCS